MPVSTYSVKEGDERGIQIAKIHDCPTVVIDSSDNLAMGLLHAFHDLNIKVPEDISIIRFDNNELSKYIKPSLNTINKD